MASEQFHFEYDGDHTLTVEELWPDGDAPENPTTEQALARVRESCSGPRDLIGDWNLGVTVYFNGEAVWL
jgi:hypothetical protein